MDFITYQQSPTLHLCCNLGALPSRRRTQIKNPFPGTRLQELSGRHGTGLLDIINARFMKRMLPGLLRLVIIKTCLRPGNRRQGKRPCPRKILRLRLQRIYPQGLMPFLLQRLGKRLIFLPQHFFHSVYKALWKHYHGSFLLIIISGDRTDTSLLKELYQIFFLNASGNFTFPYPVRRTQRNRHRTAGA